MKYIRLLRVKHWLKNFLIFFPLFFSMNFNKLSIINSIISFISFCFICSSIYIINDIKDIEKDLLHATKKNRVIARGEISIKSALIISGVLFILSLLIEFVFTRNITGLLILLIYFILNILYTYLLKNIALIDIMLLAIFFILRVYYGGIIINVEISNWLYLTIMSGSLFLAFGKRRNELKSSSSTRSVLKYYNKEFLDKFMYSSLTLMIVFYSLWAINQSVKYLSFSIPLLILIFMRYSLVVEGNSDGDPIEVLLSDKELIMYSIIYVIYVVFVFVI